MKTLIIILIIASFLESTILPLNLLLIILICRSYIRIEKMNLFLALSFGLLLSHLNLHPLGLESAIFLTLVQITQMLKKSPLSGNALLIVPLCLILLSMSGILTAIFTQKSFPLMLMPKLLIESLLSLPIFYLLRLWEERFIVRKEIKLKVG